MTDGYRMRGGKPERLVVKRRGMKNNELKH
jgi:hypothetical protein